MDKVKYIIRKGKHRVNKFITSFWFGSKQFRFKVRLTREWAQTFPGQDKDDVNKLIGLGCLNLLNLLKLKAPHHYKSLRAGLDYNESLDKMDLYTYQYVNNIRSFKVECQLDWDVDYYLELQKTCNGKAIITFTDYKGNSLAVLRGPSWNGISFLLRPYFGGNNVTQMDIPILIKRL